LVTAFLLATALFGAFKAKAIKPKKPEKYQMSTTVSGVTVAADLLLTDAEQKEFFYQPLNHSGAVPLRLAIFNNSRNEVRIPLEGIRLIAPDGKQLSQVSPEEVAQAVLKGFPVDSNDAESPALVAASPRVVNSTTDPSSPNYDPRLDPSNPSYDPHDPRNQGRPVYDKPRVVRGVDVVLNPSRGENHDGITESLIEKDFIDKAHSADPLLPSMKRDRFLYFSIAGRAMSAKGFELCLPEGEGFPGGVSLRFQ